MARDLECLNDWANSELLGRIDRPRRTMILSQHARCITGHSGGCAMGIIKTFLVWSVCVLSSALLVATASNAQDKKTLTLGTGNPEGTALTNVTVQVFQPALRKHSNGNLDVKVFFNGSQCSEQSCGEHVRLGQLDIGQVSSGNMGAFGFYVQHGCACLICSKTGPRRAECSMAGWLRKCARG